MLYIHVMYDYKIMTLTLKHFCPISFLQSFFRLERDVKRNYGPVNATDSLRTPLCILLSFGRAFGSANRKDQKFRSEIGQCSVSVMFTHA